MSNDPTFKRLDSGANQAWSGAFFGLVECWGCGDRRVRRDWAARAYVDDYGGLHPDPGAMAARHEVYFCADCAVQRGLPLPRSARWLPSAPAARE